jgi:hypothetical protein
MQWSVSLLLPEKNSLWKLSARALTLVSEKARPCARAAELEIPSAQRVHPELAYAQKSHGETRRG